MIVFLGRRKKRLTYLLFTTLYKIKHLQVPFQILADFCPQMGVFQVTFLRYTQQWKKRVVFLLNKADLYRNSSEVCIYLLYMLE